VNRSEEFKQEEDIPPAHVEHREIDKVEKIEQLKEEKVVLEEITDIR
jgi:hypothetical protein